MREIKFRGMTIDGEWFYGLVTKVKEGTFISNSVGRPLAYQVRPETIGQYTELKDKNGKEIYEGDIIEAEPLLDTGGQWETKNRFKVIFKNGSFVITLGKVYRTCDQNLEEMSFYMMKQFQPSIEIIGSIHKNLELLKEEEQ